MRSRIEYQAATEQGVPNSAVKVGDGELAMEGFTGQETFELDWVSGQCHGLLRKSHEGCPDSSVLGSDTYGCPHCYSWALVVQVLCPGLSQTQNLRTRQWSVLVILPSRIPDTQAASRWVFQMLCSWDPRGKLGQATCQGWLAVTREAPQHCLMEGKRKSALKTESKLQMVGRFNPRVSCCQGCVRVKIWGGHTSLSHQLTEQQGDNLVASSSGSLISPVRITSN